MSNITKVFDNINDNDVCLVVFDRTSADSIFGAAVVKFICEEITDTAEVVVVKEISETIGDAQYKNITYVGCHPSEVLMQELNAKYGDLLLFVTNNSTDVAKIRANAKKASIEYSENDSCAMNLYKIAFGEFEDAIPDVFRMISAYYTKNYDKDYYDGLAFSNIFVDEFVDFDTFYTETVAPILNGVDTEAENNSISKMIDDGYMELEVLEDDVVRHLPVILNDKFRVGGCLNAFAVFTNGPIRDSFIYNLEQKTADDSSFDGDAPTTPDAPETSYVAVPDAKFFEVDAMIVFYRESATEWAVEIMKIDRDYDERLDSLDEELTSIESRIKAANDLNMSTYALVKEKKSIESEITKYTRLANFNAGEYLKRGYKGSGNMLHGYAKISNKVFRKINETKAL